MDIYTLGLALGGLGLAGMALGGIGRHGDGQHSGGGHSGHVGDGGHGHIGHGGHAGHGSPLGGYAHGASAGSAHGDNGHIFGAIRGAGKAGMRGAARGARAGKGGRGASWLLALMSPRILFSVSLGFGATGALLKPLLGGPLLLVAAVVGGALFERLLVTPIWNLSLRFASNPAMTLESCVTDEATVVSSFDANGEGLIAVEVDGHLVQLLGRLQQSDRDMGVRVRAGAKVRIEDVNTERNRCTVSVI